MARVGLLHPDLMELGGAELVSAHVIHALAERTAHDLTVYTARRPDFERLDRFAGTGISEFGVETRDLPLLRVPSRLYRRLLYAWSPIVLEPDIDLLFATKGMCAFGRRPGIQYVHFPHLSSRSTLRRYHPTDYRSRYGSLWRSAACTPFDVLKPTPEPVDGVVTLANSSWTAALIQREFDIVAEVLYPPVVWNGESCPWEDREEAFVVLGAIAPHKYTVEAIRIFGALQEISNRRFQLFIVGSASNPSYATRVRVAVDETPGAELLGRLESDRLDDLLGRCKYGLHTSPHEHFGLAVAEMLEAGMIPFVPNGGGQVEVVGGLDQLIFHDLDRPSEAARRICELITTPAAEEQVRTKLAELRGRFSPARFHRRIEETVARCLEL